jgi:predicted HTH domain antitoxin
VSCADSARLEQAIALWDAEEISLKMAANMAGLCLEEFMEEVVRRGLPLLHYSSAEAYQDAKGLFGESDFIDYFVLANLYDSIVCFGCGRPDPGSLSRPPWPDIRNRLEHHSHWSPEALAAEALRYQALVDSAIPVVLCDDCWHLGYGWKSGEAERLHNRARRFANDTRRDYRLRHAQRLRWAKTTEKKRQLELLSAAFRWDCIWLLNNPGSELSYKAAAP